MTNSKIDVKTKTSSVKNDKTKKQDEEFAQLSKQKEDAKKKAKENQEKAKKEQLEKQAEKEKQEALEKQKNDKNEKIADIASEVIESVSSSKKNKSFKDTSPLESPLSYKLIGYIFIVDILKVPVWAVSVFSDDDPVKIYCPLSPLSSTSFLIAPHNFGASCHSSKSMGFSPFNKSDGCVFAIVNKFSLISSS